MAASTAPYYDPYDYAIDSNPYPIWKQLRDVAPLYYNETLDFYALSRYDDVLRASLDPTTFSSAKGTVLEMIAASKEGAPVMEMMIFMDQPRHTAIRKLSSRGFTPRRMAALETRVRELVTGMLDAFVGSDGFDYVADFGAHLPPRVICSLVGVPDEDNEQVRAWNDDILYLEEGSTEQGGERGAGAMAAFYEYIGALAAEKRARPQEDLLSVLAGSELELEDGTTRLLSDAELVEYVILVTSAGSETVARFLGNAAYVLAEHPDERRRLVESPGIIPGAVEELLRYEAPSPIQARYVTRDVQYHGTTIPEGARVALLTASAGRDERRFPDGDRFDVGRDNSNHVTFGWGIHFCLGAALARLEARVSLEETLTRFPEWTVDREGLTRVHTSTVRGYSHVPIQFAGTP